MFGTPAKPIDTKVGGFPFPKSFRILRSSEFRRVYDLGVRVPGAFFLAFRYRRDDPNGPRVGFTAPRSVGNAVARNRAKRRMREAVRTQLWKVGPRWDVVFNIRKSAAEAPWEALCREVERIFQRCRES